MRKKSMLFLSLIIMLCFACGGGGDGEPGGGIGYSTSGTASIPDEPQARLIEVGRSQIMIAWDAVDGATGYAVYRVGSGSPLGTTTNLYFLDYGLGTGVTYSYYVQALNGSQQSGPSNTIAGTTQIWTKQIFQRSMWNYAFVQRIASDSNYVYMAGFTQQALFGQTLIDKEDGVIVKCDLKGNVLQAKLISVEQQPADTCTHILDVMVGPGGDIYVCGYFGDPISPTYYRAFWSKYDSNLNLVQGPVIFGSGGNFALRIKLDSQGNVYAAGTTRDSFNGQPYMGGEDSFIIKFDSSGSPLWTRFIGSAGYDTVTNMDMDSSGNVYLSGYSNGTLEGRSSGGGYDWFMAKYIPDGTRQWLAYAGGASDDYLRAVAVDASNNVYGALESAGYLSILKFDPQTGAVAETKPYPGQSSGCIFVNDLIADMRTGNLYVTGTANDSIGGQTYQGWGDGFIIKYEPGTAAFQTTLFGGPDSEAWEAICMGPYGQIYMSVDSSGIDGLSGDGTYLGMFTPDPVVWAWW